MEKRKVNKMGVEPMLPMLVKMSLPAMFSMLVMALYNVVDSIFIANFDKDALTAVSLAFPMQTMLIAVAVGTGVGINSLVSRRLGEKRYDEANSAVTHGVLLAIICGIVFAIVGITVARPFIGAFTDTQSVIEYGTSYLSIVLGCSFSVFLQINLEKSLQATGNMIYPMLFQLSGAVTNIILDPIMIFGYFGFPSLGVTGAAIATVAGQVVAMVFSLVIFHVKSHEVKIHFKGFKPQMKIVRDIYQVGFPAMVMQAVAAVLTTALNMILVTFSETAVSVLGVYYKLQSFVFMPVFGLTQSMMSVIGFNFGAGKKKRMMSAFKIGMIAAVGILLVGFLLFELFPRELLSIFDPTEEMLEIGVTAFRIIAICFIPAAVGIICSTLFQAIGMGVKSLIISLLRQLVIILPLAYILSKTGLNNVWFAFPLAEIFGFVISIIMVRDVYKKHIATIPDEIEA